jgi:hypothetical protein
VHPRAAQALAEGRGRRHHHQTTTARIGGKGHSDMEQGTLLKIAQFRTLAARKGKVFDVVRFASDRHFASQTLTQVLTDADEELLMAGLALMDLLGMTQQPGSRSGGSSSSRHAAPAAVPAAPAPAPAAPPPYIGRLR